MLNAIVAANVVFEDVRLKLCIVQVQFEPHAMAVLVALGMDMGNISVDSASAAFHCTAPEADAACFLPFDLQSDDSENCLQSCGLFELYMYLHNDFCRRNIVGQDFGIEGMAVNRVCDLQCLKVLRVADGTRTGIPGGLNFQSQKINDLRKKTQNLNVLSIKK